jgi:hypothetical protein
VHRIYRTVPGVEQSMLASDNPKSKKQETDYILCRKIFRKAYNQFHRLCVCFIEFYAKNNASACQSTGNRKPPSVLLRNVVKDVNLKFKIVLWQIQAIYNS